MRCFYLFFSTIFIFQGIEASALSVKWRNQYPVAVTDTGTKAKKADTLFKAKKSAKAAPQNGPAELPLRAPGVSLQQYIKGQLSGLYVTEPSGEPGTVQNMYLRGASVPVMSAKDAYRTQPLVVIDGVPVNSSDHPFAYDIQQYDFNRIGPATNLLSNFDPDNFESIVLVKDISMIAKYGPRAADGVIVLTSKQPQSIRQLSFDTYFGMAVKNPVTTLNGASESAFRKPFYDRYATADQKLNIPPYLRDSLYAVYFGPSNWNDLYYRNAMLYNANLTLTAGNKGANFRAGIGTTSNQEIADATSENQYNAFFNLKMNPTKILSFDVDVKGSQLLRDRNRYQRDRFAEVRYLPDLTNPLSPNKIYYQGFLDQYAKAFDNNKTNDVDASVVTSLTFDKLKISNRLAVDYREGYRDVFFPSTILETNSYVSDYFGYSQRLIVDNWLSYYWNINKNNRLDIEVGQSLQLDSYLYNYGYAYHGTSDYIKLNIQNDPTNPTVAYFYYQSNLGFLNTLSYRYTDQTKANLLSFYGNASYKFGKYYSLALLLRTDGSSNEQPTNRWFVSPVLSGTWNVKQQLLASNKTVSQFDVKAGYGRLGRLKTDDRYAVGPQYVVDIGFTNEPRLGSYQGVAPLNRPYTNGWIGYNIPWAYTEQVNIGTTIGLWNNRLNLAIDAYSRTTNNEIFNVPDYADYGYASANLPGLKVNNRGVDGDITAVILPQTHKIGWTSSLNFNINSNQLKALPNGLNQIVIGTRLLQVGKPIDQYWVYQNQGIYNSASEIPVNPKTNTPITFQGIPFQAGDPKWADNNGDYVVNDADKVLKGHILPVVSGGFTNDFSYGKFSMSVNFYYNLGRDIINQDMAKRFDFINQQSTNNINAVKEITFWEKRGDYSRYPIYNPWSPVIPYRPEQDLFLENGSFIKLRSVTLSYDLTKQISAKSKIGRFIIYTTASNLFTLTPYSGRDPELVEYTGYDSGYGLPIPRTFIIGAKVNFE